MDIKYNHLLVEKGKNKKWIDKKYFSTHNKDKKPFSIILPPPNVTGKLHLGHAWDGFLQDSIIRYKKLQGYDVCFVPGMDHAGIATQAKVEQRLVEQKIDKHKIGREKFIEQTFLWKDEYAQHIKNQWHKLGLALDYDSERFTLDNQSNNAVNKVFIDMYNKGLIYKGVRPINWDPKLKTALSNIEVISKPTKSKMFYVKYLIENTNEYLIVATTRIETIFSDVAIALNPQDERFKRLKGKFAINPLNKRRLPIISDEYISLDFGTGAMKVSAHAMADIEIITKNNLEIIESISQDGLMNENGLFTQNLDRNEARIKVEEFLSKNNMLDKVEEIENNVSYSERSHEVVEILVMPQWFVKMDSLAKKILDNLDTKDKVKIYPQKFEKILKIWMSEIHDWTISRQLWWGHRIPAWYKGEEIKVQIESPGQGWVQDEDVLDTWFSSALCPFSFLGWPEKTDKLAKFFPTSLLVTGYDIIFFWVARMYFQSLEFMNSIPFKDLLIHGLIRDEKGRKMSKSLGNGIDPMDLIEKYGSDSLRWYLITQSSPGQDINFSIEKLEMSWSLNNKLWNISRFITMMEDSGQQELTIFDKWITNKFLNLKVSIEEKMKKYDFTIIGKEISNFIYNDFSSWYIEFSKVNQNKKHAIKILKNLLILVHPFLPFLTDHIYKEIFSNELLESEFDKDWDFDIASEDQVKQIINVITLIRNARSDFDISNKEVVDYSIKNNENDFIIPFINKLANANYKENTETPFMLNETTIYVSLSNEAKSKEIIKLEEQIAKVKSEIERSENILQNEKFIKNASPEKVQIEKDKYEEYLSQMQLLTNKLKELK